MIVTVPIGICLVLAGLLLVGLGPMFTTQVEKSAGWGCIISVVGMLVLLCTAVAAYFAGVG